MVSGTVVVGAVVVGTVVSGTVVSGAVVTVGSVTVLSITVIEPGLFVTVYLASLSTAYLRSINSLTSVVPAAAVSSTLNVAENILPLIFPVVSGANLNAPIPVVLSNGDI